MNLDVVQIIMDCWHKIIDGWEKMDTNIINAMIQSLATILAVAVGFFFRYLVIKGNGKELKLSKLESINYHLY